MRYVAVEDQKYIPHARYLVEVLTEKTGQKVLTKRISNIVTATNIKDKYNILKGCKAQILDTKEGKII